MAENNSVRVDKFLWAVRIFKTRSQAADACKKGHVLIDDEPVKASRIVNLNDKIDVRKSPILFSYKVNSLLKNRIGAKFVPNYIDNITSDEEMLKSDINERGGFYYRDRGSGRPTKKDRRIIDKINDTSDD